MKIPKTITPDSAKWIRRLVKIYEPDQAEEQLLLRAAEMRDQAARAALQIEEDGPYFENRFGEPRQHPAIRVQQQSIDLMARLLKQLGISKLEVEQ